MKFSIIQLIKRDKKILAQKTLAEYKQDLIIQYGREQIKNLVKRGLGLPIAFG